MVQGAGVKEESVSPGNPGHFTSGHFNILNSFFKLSSCFMYKCVFLPARPRSCYCSNEYQNKHMMIFD